MNHCGKLCVDRGFNSVVPSELCNVAVENFNFSNLSLFKRLEGRGLDRGILEL